MIILRNKLFSDERDIIISHAGFIINELIKIILFGEKCKQDIPHWISNTLGAINKSKTKFKYLANIKTITILFLGIFDRVKDKQFKSIYEEFKNTGITYIKDRLNEVYNQKDKGNYKYRHLVDPGNIDWNDLMIKLKYIALCISGQLNPENDNFYELYNKISSIKINFNRQYSGDLKVLLEKIIHEQFYL